jgi:predicted transport protein
MSKNHHIYSKITHTYSKAHQKIYENATEEFLKLYVAFKLDTNFVDVVPQASGLRLSLNCKYKDIHDPKGLCKDVTDIGRWGNGDVELKISQVSEIPYAVELIQQVIDMQIEG